MWHLIIDILLILAIIHICKGAFKYIPISILHHYFIPAYSIIIFLINMEWNQQDLILFAILLPIGIAIGFYETRKLEIEKRWSLKKNRFLYYVKRNKPYIIGWIITLLLGVTMTAIFKRESITSLFTNKIFENIFEEVDPLLIFTTKRPWYTWLLSGASSVTFTIFAQHKIIGLEHAKNIKTISKEEVEAQEKKKEQKEKA